MTLALLLGTSFNVFLCTQLNDDLKEGLDHTGMRGDAGRILTCEGCKFSHIQTEVWDEIVVLEQI